jgi:hypothetical protein
MWLLGDKHPDSYACFDILTTKTAEQFNIDNPTPSGILCQSYGFKVKGAFSDSMFCITHPIVRKFDGDNDGLVSTDSMHWANFRGSAPPRRTRHPPTPTSSTSGAEDLPSAPPPPTAKSATSVPFYVGVVSELKEMGY